MGNVPHFRRCIAIRNLEETAARRLELPFLVGLLTATSPLLHDGSVCRTELPGVHTRLTVLVHYVVPGVGVDGRRWRGRIASAKARVGVSELPHALGNAATTIGRRGRGSAALLVASDRPEADAGYPRIGVGVVSYRRCVAQCECFRCAVVDADHRGKAQVGRHSVRLQVTDRAVRSVDGSLAHVVDGRVVVHGHDVDYIYIDSVHLRVLQKTDGIRLQAASTYRQGVGDDQARVCRLQCGERGIAAIVSVGIVESRAFYIEVQRLDVVLVNDSLILRLQARHSATGKGDLLPARPAKRNNHIAANGAKVVDRTGD